MDCLFFAGIIGDTAREFGVNWHHFIAQALSFAIVAFLLRRFAYRPVLLMLEERKRLIAEGVQNSEKIREELARAGTERQKILLEANTRAQALIEEAREAAARVQEQETQKAIAAAESIIAKAREAAAQDHARMLAELKREVGRLVVQTTATVTGKVLTPEDQSRLSEETARQVATQ